VAITTQCCVISQILSQILSTSQWKPKIKEHQFKKSTTKIKYLTSHITVIEKDKRRSDATTLLKKDNNKYN
jgi:hypothetical protein